MREELIKHLQNMTDEEFESLFKSKDCGCPSDFGLYDDMDICMTQKGDSCYNCWKKALK